MSTAEIKNHLHKLIVETDDPEMLAQIQSVFLAIINGKVDWADFLSEQEERMIDIGIKQAEGGMLIPHEQVRKKIDQWLSEKGK